MNAAFYNDMVSLAAALYANDIGECERSMSESTLRQKARRALEQASIFADEQAVFLEQRREQREAGR
jgi:hypothetical protein